MNRHIILSIHKRSVLSILNQLSQLTTQCKLDSIKSLAKMYEMIPPELYLSKPDQVLQQEIQEQ